MADQVMTITPIVKGGILDVAGNANAKAGNAAAGASPRLRPRPGR